MKIASGLSIYARSSRTGSLQGMRIVRFGTLSLNSVVFAIMFSCGIPATVRAECVSEPYIPFPAPPYICSGDPAEAAACRRAAEQARIQEEAASRRAWEQRQLDCQKQERARDQAQRERQERERLAREQADRQRLEQERLTRERADTQRREAARRAADVAEQDARRAGAERDRQRAEVEKAQLLAATEKARAEAAEAERKRHAAESPLGLSMLSPNSYPALAIGFVFVALITWITSLVTHLFTHGGRFSVWRDISIQSVASIVSGSVLSALGIVTDITWLSIPILGGLFSIGLTVSAKHA
jgi:hypothetical protein